ncbi:MAG: electron transporter RnfB, partial [Proteobacteria bacterium]|nr:electron transporter RnfB [Pseudomonadota bacterium]
GEDGQLNAIEYADLDTGMKQVLDTDTLIIGSGRFPELVFIPVRKEVQDGEEDLIENNGPLAWEGHELQKKPDSNKELGLLSSQDSISEYSSAVAAINGGRKAAAAIHNLMYGIQFQEPSKFITEQTMLQDVSSLNNVGTFPKIIMELGRAEKNSIDKFSTGFSEEQARDEANRCLRCGLVCYEKSKVIG